MSYSFILAGKTSVLSNDCITDPDDKNTTFLWRAEIDLGYEVKTQTHAYEINTFWMIMIVVCWLRNLNVKVIIRTNNFGICQQKYTGCE